MNYLTLWWALAKNNLSRMSEFKYELMSRMIVEIIWMSSQVLFFVSVFQFTDRLAGWTKAEMIFFTGTTIFVDGIMMALFHDNLNRMGRLIRLGLMDFYLLYPGSVTFLANFRFVNVIAFCSNALTGLLVCAWASTLPGIDLNFMSILIWFVYALLGAALVICLGMSVAASVFWTTQSSSTSWIYFELYRLSFRPESLYGPWIQRFLLYVFPAALFMSVPVQLALGKLDGLWFVYPWIILAIAMAVTRKIWKRGLAQYEGALS